MTKKNKFLYYLGVFFISPVLALISGMANFKNTSAKYIIILFIGIFGFTFIFTPGKDSYDIKESFENYFPQLSSADFFDQVGRMVTLRKTVTTFDEPFYYSITYVIAQFTNSDNLLFLIIGLIFGFFYVKAIDLVYQEKETKWNLSLAVLFVFFISWISLSGLNAPRNWTAAYVYFCGTLLYLKTSKRKFIFLVLFAPFIHFSYLLITLPLLIYVFFKDLKYLYLTILLVSYLVTASTSFIKPYLEATSLGKDKVSAYVESDRWRDGAEDRTEMNLKFHATYYRIGSDIAIQFMFISAILFLGYINNKKHDPFLTGLASIAIMILSLSNIFSSIPVLSGRLFANFGNFSLAYLILLYAKNYSELKSHHWIVYICMPAIFLFLFTQWSIIGDYIDFKVLFSPLSYPFLGDDPVSVKEFLRQFWISS